MGITRIGSRDIQKALKKWGSAIESDVTRIVYETARIIEAEAKALAPVDEGHLRDSIEMQITGEYSAVVTVGAHYSVYIEYGTGIYAVKGDGRKTSWAYLDPKGRVDENGNPLWIWTKGMAAQPFWFPAIEAGEKYFYAQFRKLGK